MSEQRDGLSEALVVHNDEARLAEALRRCGVEVGSVGGDHFRRVVAGRLLESEWLAGYVARREAAAAAEAVERALREAADAWTQGQWSDVMLPKPTPPAVPVIAYSNRMGDWLRGRADRVAGGEGTA